MEGFPHSGGAVPAEVAECVLPQAGIPHMRGGNRTGGRRTPHPRFCRISTPAGSRRGFRAEHVRPRGAYRTTTNRLVSVKAPAVIVYMYIPLATAEASQRTS